MSDDIWRNKELGAIAHVEMGQAPPSEYVTDREMKGSLPFLQGNSEFTDTAPTAKLWCIRFPKSARRGDALISVRAPVGELNQADQDYAIGRGLAAVRFWAVLSRYGYYQLAFRKVGLRRVAQGSTFDAIGSRELKSLIFPVPPSGEQRRIAEILDTLDHQIRAAEEIISKMRLVASGVADALLGDWGNGEVTPGKWRSHTVGETCQVQAGITLGPHRRPLRGAIGYLRVANVQRAAINLTDISLLQASLLEQQNYQLRGGDLLVVEGHADVNQIGRCARVLDDAAGLVYQNHLFRIRTTAVNPVIAEAWLNSRYARRYWRQTCSSSSGLNSINSKQVKAMKMIVPPPDEQRRMVGVLDGVGDRIKKECDVLEKLVHKRTGLMNDLLTGRVRIQSKVTS